MTRDERFYAFIVARTSRSRATIRRVAIHKRWVKLSAGALALIFCVALYGLYGLVRQGAHLRLEHENSLLREENLKQRRQLDLLMDRVERIEDTSRRLSEISGVARPEEEGTSPRGAGGPSIAADVSMIVAVAQRAARLESELQVHEEFLLARAPSIWPVEGELTDGFGLRRDPFGDGPSEFHAGQDIASPRGTPVVATGSGTVSFSGVQNGYGRLVVVDHGKGLTTRYGHLSQVDVADGQWLARGERLGRVGSTGRSTGPHLHYEVRIGESAVSPRRYLPSR